MWWRKPTLIFYDSTNFKFTIKNAIIYIFYNSNTFILLVKVNKSEPEYMYELEFLISNHFSLYLLHPVTSSGFGKIWVNGQTQPTTACLGMAHKWKNGLHICKWFGRKTNQKNSP